MRVHHLAFRTRDLARLERFYVGRLGLRVGKRSERSIWLRLGAGVLMLELAEPGEPTVPAGSLELVASTRIAHPPGSSSSCRGASSRRTTKRSLPRSARQVPSPTVTW